MSSLCICGYTSAKPATVRRHQKVCKQHLVNEALRSSVNDITQQERQQERHIAALEARLEEKDRQIAQQAEEIKLLIKRPRTVNNNNTTNNRYVVEQHINVFGKETLSHISPQQIQCLLADPENAVAKFVKLKHREPSNANVRCPNVNRAVYQVVVEGASEEGEKEWENRAKGEVLEKLYDDNSSILEGEAMEEEHTSFLDHQDSVKASAAANAADGGRVYRDQLDRIHNVVINRS